MKNFIGETTTRNLNLVNSATKDWGWVIVGGIVSVILGFCAWAVPYSATRGIVLGLGIILLIGGIVGLVQAFRFTRFGGTGWRVFQSLLAVAAGAIMLKHPGVGTIGVGFAICLYLFMSAASQFMMAYDLRPVDGSAMLYVSALISFALGVILLASMPVSAFFIPGIFLAVDLIVGGFTAIGIGMRLRKIHKYTIDRGERPPEATRAA